MAPAKRKLILVDKVLACDEWVRGVRDVDEPHPAPPTAEREKRESAIHLVGRKRKMTGGHLDSRVTVRAILCDGEGRSRENKGAGPRTTVGLLVWDRRR